MAEYRDEAPTVMEEIDQYPNEYWANAIDTSADDSESEDSEGQEYKVTTVGQWGQWGIYSFGSIGGEVQPSLYISTATGTAFISEYPRGHAPLNTHPNNYAMALLMF